MAHLLKILSAGVLCLVLTGFGFAQGKGKGSGNGGGGDGGGGGFLSVCVTFEVDDNKITSDGGQYCDAVAEVEAIVGLKNGGFRLSTNGRKVNLDFGDCADDPCTVPADAPGAQAVDLVLGDEYEYYSTYGGYRPPGNKLDIVEMEIGPEPSYGALYINFVPDGETTRTLMYRLVFGRLGPTECTVDDYGNSDPVTVTHDDQNSWTMSAGAEDEACLFEITKNFKRQELLGRFNMPFEITIDEMP